MRVHGAAPGPPDAGAEQKSGGDFGRLVVVGMLGLGAALALYAVAHQREQTRRCLGLFGADAAKAIASAAHVELWRLRPTGRDGRLEAVTRRDVSRAAGLVHLRRGLVEDANYTWPTGPVPEARLPPAAWDWALVFADGEAASEAGEPILVVLDLPAGPSPPGDAGWLAVVGRAGRVRLGRIGPGLERWIAEAGGLAPGGRVGQER
jgi:hypothetical protein